MRGVCSVRKMVTSDYLSVLLLLSMLTCSGMSARPSRIVRIRQGKLQGIVLVPANPKLEAVEAFLGVPYAGPPVGRLRFMPPSAPQSWPSSVVRRAAEFGPVCPQIVPDLTKEKVALRFMTEGRMNYLKKLFVYLKQNQSEDCLYLNLYSPEKKSGSSFQRKLPVIVFIHGESYEWNSGNPYDGSVLSSYGQVVVITLNYRLGILGFLKTGLEDNVIGNFGLLDLIAALHWIQENIGVFGGDPDSVTLMGHGTGASLVSLLLLSPVSQGSTQLFHRAILMSGSSLARSAIVRDPRDVTRQVANDMNCPLQLGHLAECLREKDVKSLLNYQVKSPAYSTPVGPYVDGTIIPKEPGELISRYSPRYDLLFGVTESEAFHLFPAFTVNYGISQAEKRDILRSMITSEFETYGQNLEQTIQTVLNEYRDFHQTREDKLINLHILLEIFSDARVVAPLFRTADLLSSGSKPGYFYVFSHSTENGYYPKEFGSVHGEELAYVLGMPLVGGTFHFVHNYTVAEESLALSVMSYWVNFAKTGSPGPSSGYTSGHGSSTKVWPQYDVTQKKYMLLDLETKVDSYYKSHKLAIWNKIVPDIVENIDKRLTGSDGGMTGNTGTDEEFPANKYIPGAPENQEKNKVVVENIPANIGNFSATNRQEPEGIFDHKNLPISLIVIIGFLLLTINLLACAGVYYQKKKVSRRELNLERKMKRLSDAGYRSAEEFQPNLTGSETRGDSTYNTLTSNKSENGSIKRAHFQQERSNSVREVVGVGGDAGQVLKSAMKKPANASTEVISDTVKGNKVVYTDESFAEAAYPVYPSLTRQSKSIPNISYSQSLGRRSDLIDDNDSLRGGKERPLSRSSTMIDTELRGDARVGPDVLVFYDTRPDDEKTPSDDGRDTKSVGGGGLTSSLSRRLPAFLQRRGRDDRPPPPIIEMVPVSIPPSTYQFPSRSSASSGNPIYATTRFPPSCQRQLPGLGGSEFGITYPNYAFTQPSRPSLNSGHALTQPSRHSLNTSHALAQPNRHALPSPAGHYIAMSPQIQLTTPRPPLHLQLHHQQQLHGSLPRGKMFSDNYGVTKPRLPWVPHTVGEQCLYGYSVPPNCRASPTLSRMSSIDMPPSQRNSILEQSSSDRTQNQDRGVVGEVGGKLLPAQKDNLSLNRQISQDCKQPQPQQQQEQLRQQQLESQKKLEATRNLLPLASPKAAPLKSGELSPPATFVPVTTQVLSNAAASPQSLLPTPNKAPQEANSQPAQLAVAGGEENSGGGGTSSEMDQKSSSVENTQEQEKSKAPVKTPIILRKVGEKTPPGTLKRDNSSCKSWYSQYSQSFLSKTIDTPTEDLPPLGDEEFDDDDDDDESSENSKDSQS